MILQALTDYYKTLADKGQISPPGWAQVKISYALCIDDSGVLEQVISLQTEQSKGKKMVLSPQSILLPAPVKRSSGVSANFLCDNSSYLLGIDNKGKPKRSIECFQTCKALHETILSSVDCPAAKALLTFFQTWKPDQAADHPALAEYRDEIVSGANLVFRYNGQPIQEDPLICRAWDTHYQSEKDGCEMICLVTGEKGPVESVHPSKMYRAHSPVVLHWFLSMHPLFAPMVKSKTTTPLPANMPPLPTLLHSIICLPIVKMSSV